MNLRRFWSCLWSRHRAPFIANLLARRCWGTFVFVNMTSLWVFGGRRRLSPVSLAKERRAMTAASAALVPNAASAAVKPVAESA